MKITSQAFAQYTEIPAKYTCIGENVSPPLAFSGVPIETKSLLLIVDDPDASPKTWVHWLVYNIPPGTPEIAENSMPAGASQGMTDFGKPGYSGPCPPSGVHHYRFKLYALATVLNFPVGKPPTKADIEQAMSGHVLEEAELVGLFSK